MPKPKREPDLEAFRELFEVKGGERPEHVNWPIGGNMQGGPGSLRQHIWNYRAGVAAIAEKMDGGQTELVFPWMNLARHTLELAMKEVVQRSIALGIVTWSDLSTTWTQDKLWKTHDLGSLAKLITALLAKEGDQSSRDAWAKIAPLMEKWESADPNGQAFRYARDSTGAAIVTEPAFADGVEEDGMMVYPTHNITHKGIEPIYDKAMNFLHDGLGGMLDHLKENLQQAREEARQYAEDSAL